MARKIDLAPIQAPIVDDKGRLTNDARAIFQEIAKMLRDLEARIEALEP